MTTIYAASDLHGNLTDPPRCDVLILAGDICPDFRPYGNRIGAGYGVDKGGTRQARWLDTTFRRWVTDIAYLGTHVIAIWGNHDFVGETPFLVPRLPWTLLQDSETQSAGLRVWGTPWVPNLPYWAFYGREEALQARAEAIPDGIDILVTHGPPYGHGDFLPPSPRQRSKHGNFAGEYVGDPTLNEAIGRVKPQTVICGHIHEARGRYALDKSRVYNVAAVDEFYDLHDEPFTRIN